MSNEISRPTSAGSGTWNTTTVANINEAVTQPSTSGDSTYCQHNGSSSKTQVWECGAPSNSGTMTAVSVWLRTACEEDGDNTMDVRVRLNGSWTSLTTADNTLTIALQWKEYTGSVSGSLSGSAPAIEVTGVGTSSSSRGYLYVAYMDITYTTATGATYNTGPTLLLL